MTAKVSEKVLFSMMQGFPDQPIPDEIFESSIIIRIMAILNIIDTNIARVGIDLYSLDVGDIASMLSAIEMPGDVTESIIYKSMKGLETAGIVSIERKGVASYQETAIPFPREGTVPYAMFLDASGNEIAPSSMASQSCKIFAENGEQTIKAYRLTERGKALLKKYEEVKKLVG